METLAVVLDAPEQLVLRRLDLTPRAADHVLVDVEWSGISTGTERLFYTGRMPPFPGMGYPLVPGYESVGRVVESDGEGGLRPGDRVFIPGASCFGEVRGLFGGAASRLAVPASRLTKLDENIAEEGILLALAATARHALAGGAMADLIIGHGVLGRLLARIAVATGGNPVVWETNPARAAGARDYTVIDPRDDTNRQYRAVYDVSGDATIVGKVLPHMARGGEIVLAGFYTDPISFAFPPAFLKEARLRVAAEWAPDDMTATTGLIAQGRLHLDGLITHRRPFTDAADAYATAFADPNCLKMLLDWRGAQ